MSIFGIIILSFLIGALIALLLCLPFYGFEFLCDYPRWQITIVIGVLVLVTIVGTLLGIGIVTRDERVFIAKYEAQKVTIEQSLTSDVLSGLERIELVNKAVDLNGELAERKAKCDRWDVVLYDESMYNNVEFIKFN